MGGAAIVFEVVTYAKPIVTPALPPLEDGEEPHLDQPGMRIILGGQDRARDEGIGRLIVSTRAPVQLAPGGEHVSPRHASAMPVRSARSCARCTTISTFAVETPSAQPPDSCTPLPRRL
jgi:hypothetical protein